MKLNGGTALLTALPFLRCPLSPQSFLQDAFSVFLPARGVLGSRAVEVGPLHRGRNKFSDLQKKLSHYDWSRICIL